MILLSASIIIAFPVPAPAQAQNTADNASASAGTDAGDIGSFDIDKVFEDVSGGGDTALASSAASAFPRQPENYALVMLRIVGYLAVITMVIVALAWAVRKFGVAGVSKVGGGNNMDVIETLYLGQNKGAALVRLGDTVYFLGHTSENIVLLEKIEGEKAIEFIASSKGGTSIMNFKDAFNNFLGKMKRS
jgi:flagellar biosynthetic protein FliO